MPSAKETFNSAILKVQKSLRALRLICVGIGAAVLSAIAFVGHGNPSTAISLPKMSLSAAQSAPSTPSQETFASISDLLKLSEHKIDIGLVALILAKQIYPEIDVAAYSRKIDVLAAEVRRLANGTQDPDRRIRCLNTVLLLHERFRGTRSDSSARRAENYFLNHLLDTKRGNCFTMPVLYVAVAQRLGWPVYQVNLPDHSFVRYVDPHLKEQNIETTSNGGYVADEIYAKDFLVSESGRKSGAYLKTLSYRELLGDLAAVNGITFGREGRLLKAITYLKVATTLNPSLAGAWMNLGSANEMMARRLGNAAGAKYFAESERCSKKLIELGFVNPNNVPQLSSTGRRA